MVYLTLVSGQADALIILAISINALTVLTFVSVVDVQAFALTVGVTYPSISAWIIYLRTYTVKIVYLSTVIF